uniref:carboxypeptidase regulatory-like domain-containing protein n=1 Tax=uncultured Bacteroides sp. TaxID=162156 RepID=UPI0026253A90
MKKIRTLFISVCVFISVGVSAQTVSGKLIDENSQPLPYANVVLLSLPDSAFVSGATSDDKGNFVLKDLSARSYLLQVSYIGYQPQSILLENLDRKINLGDIRLV